MKRQVPVLLSARGSSSRRPGIHKRQTCEAWAGSRRNRSRPAASPEPGFRQSPIKRCLPVVAHRQQIFRLMSRSAPSTSTARLSGRQCEPISRAHQLIQPGLLIGKPVSESSGGKLEMFSGFLFPFSGKAVLRICGSDWIERTVEFRRLTVPAGEMQSTGLAPVSLVREAAVRQSSAAAQI